jgi:hypothetical protein
LLFPIIIAFYLKFKSSENTYHFGDKYDYEDIQGATDELGLHILRVRDNDMVGIDSAGHLQALSKDLLRTAQVTFEIATEPPLIKPGLIGNAGVGGLGEKSNDNDKRAGEEPGTQKKKGANVTTKPMLALKSSSRRLSLVTVKKSVAGNAPHVPARGGISHFSSPFKQPDIDLEAYDPDDVPVTVNPMQQQDQL